MATQRPGLSWFLLIVLGLAAAYLVYRIFSHPEPPSLWLIIFAAVLLAAILVAGAALVFKRHSEHWTDFSAFAQGLASIVTIAALFIAAGIYFAERRDKPKLAIAVVTNAIALPQAGNGVRELLLTIQIPVENKGAGRVEIKCMSLGLSGLPAGARPRRAQGASEEIEFEAIGPPVNYTPGEICNRSEERRKRLAQGAVTPLYRWTSLALEPGEVDDRYFEMTISCRYAMARVLVKLRINAHDKYGYESKALIPLAAVCSGARELATGISAPTDTGERDKSAADSLESNLQTPPSAF